MTEIDLEKAWDSMSHNLQYVVYENSFVSSGNVIWHLLMLAGDQKFFREFYWSDFDTNHSDQLLFNDLNHLRPPQTQKLYCSYIQNHFTGNLPTWIMVLL